MSVGKMEPACLIFEKSLHGHGRDYLGSCDVPAESMVSLFGSDLLREAAPDLPEVAENEVVRHYNALSRKNYGVDTGPYPLGSCTMKYNPKVNEDAAALPGFAGVHPLQDPETAQGCLELMHELEEMLCAICGTARFTLQPAAGAHGELTGLMMIRAYHQSRSDTARKVMIIPDSAHGTNPASAMMVGFTVREIRSNSDGMVDIDALKSALGPDTAGFMLTNPNTLGLFECQIAEIADLVHEAGGLLYYDGANANAILMQSRPGDMGFDVVHLNLHKTFSTPHGGGGPGAGPVGVCERLVPFLPSPVVNRSIVRDASGSNTVYSLDSAGPLSIGRVRAFNGNFGMLVRAYAYIRSHGAPGLKVVSEAAVTNANYLLHRIRPYFDLPFDQPVLHEFVLSGVRQKEKGCSTLDMAKRLIDYGFYPPTVYFPLTVKEAMMFEPTETESLDSLDDLADAMTAIAQEVLDNPDLLHDAPHDTPVSRPDELKAARNPILHG